MKRSNWLWIIGGALIIIYSMLRFAGEKVHAMYYISHIMYYIGIAMELAAILSAKGKSNTIAYISGIIALAVLTVPIILPVSALALSLKSILSIATLVTLAIIAWKMYKKHKWIQALGISFIIIFAVGLGMSIIGNVVLFMIGNHNAVDFIKGFVSVTGTAYPILAGAMFILIGKTTK